MHGIVNALNLGIGSSTSGDSLKERTYNLEKLNNDANIIHFNRR